MKTCSRCDASIPVEARVCPDCGAPLVPGAKAEIPEDIHRELARSNLLRMRGEFDAAETACLSVLKRFPNSAPAHTLLGDIADDRGNLEEAERWYELALDLDPESAGDRRKLEDVRARRRKTEVDLTVEQIGLPAKRAIPWFQVVVGSLALVSLAGAAYVGIQQRNAPRPAVVIAKPVQAPPTAVTPTPVSKEEATDSPTATIANPVAPLPKVEPTDSATPPSSAASQDDEALLRTLAQRTAFGSSLLQAQFDPRAKVMTLTFALRPTDDARHVASELARGTLDADLETLSVTLRAIRDRRLVYVADVPRTRYADTLLAGWQEDNANNSSAFMDYVLANEWNAPSSSIEGESVGNP